MWHQLAPPIMFLQILSTIRFSGALVGAKVTPALAIGMFQLFISTNFMSMDNPLGNFIVNIWAITPDCFYACPVKRVRLFDTGRKEANPPKLSVSGGAAKVVPLGAGEHTPHPCQTIPQQHWKTRCTVSGQIFEPTWHHPSLESCLLVLLKGCHLKKQEAVGEI